MFTFFIYLFKVFCGSGHKYQVFLSYTNNLYVVVWFGLVVWHINHCGLFNVKSSFYIYIKYLLFGLVGFYAISTIVGYSMLHPLYSYILNIYGLVWLGWVLWHIDHCRLFTAKSSLYIYIKYI